MSALRTIAEYGARIDGPAEEFLTREPRDLYGMLKYFMGYSDTEFVPASGIAGKRVRPGLALYVADAYGESTAAAKAALSIELFHNFSLIHDDIEDHDEFRRGRETVWKVWGVNKALNAGDAQLLLALLALKGDIDSVDVESYLLTQYLRVIEGQHQDFSLTELPLSDSGVTKEAYMQMIGNKSAELISASAVVGGLSANVPASDIELLRVFGFELGLAYQLFDDYQSIWGSEKETGKKAMGDLIERKKTLPVIWARDTLSNEGSTELVRLFNDSTATHSEDILLLLEKVNAKEYLMQTVAAHVEKSLSALASLQIAQEHKDFLADFVNELVPQK